MTRYACATFIAMLSLLLASGTIYAQQPKVPADLTTTISRVIGAQTGTVEIAVRGNILTVLRINSNTNQSTHGGRDNEANAIAPVVSKAISGLPEFNNLHTIRVQYVVRSAPGAATKIIDTIDFRKAPGGAFEFHKT
jgi:hypothetical protein